MISRRWLFILPLLALTGCGHNLYLVGRSTAKTGHARIVAVGHSGDVTMEVAGTQYAGRWVYMPSGGSFGVASTTAFSGGHTASAVGNFTALPTEGNGSILAAAGDGTQLRCVFAFNAMGQTGMGECQDTAGEIYDLQID